MNRLEGHFHRLVVEESCPGELVDLCVKMAGGSERERTKLYLPSPAGGQKKKILISALSNHIVLRVPL